MFIYRNGYPSKLKLKGRFMGFVTIKIERKIYGTKHIHMSMASPKRVAKF